MSVSSSSSSSFDVVVIGGGPGGYVGAIRCAQLGMRVALVERESRLGGVCLREGCIPSKALLHASERWEESRKHFPRMGLAVEGRVDLSAMMRFKESRVAANAKGVEHLLKKNGVERIEASAALGGKGRVVLEGDSEGRREVLAKSVILATGSRSVELPNVSVDEKRILSSTGALSLDRVPSSLLVIGGGAIGLELGSVWRRLGSEVTVVEVLPRLLPDLDEDVAVSYMRILKKQGLKFRLGTKVLSASSGKKEVLVEFASADAKGDSESESATFDSVLSCVGRRASVEGLGLAEHGVELESDGSIRVDSRFSAAEGVYAIGDAIRGPMLAHKAEEEGVVLAELLAGQKPEVRHALIPSVIYTYPEAAWIGRGEDALKAEGRRLRSGTFPLMANGRAKISSEGEGVAKLVADADTDEVLGAQLIAPSAGEMIHEIAVLMTYRGASEDLARICHAHPTLSEAVREAALAADQRAIHV